MDNIEIQTNEATELYISLSFAILSLRDMHGSKTGDADHVGDADVCTCTYGKSIRELKSVRQQVRDALKRMCSVV